MILSVLASFQRQLDTLFQTLPRVPCEPASISARAVVGSDFEAPLLKSEFLFSNLGGRSCILGYDATFTIDLLVAPDSPLTILEDDVAKTACANVLVHVEIWRAPFADIQSWSRCDNFIVTASCLWISSGLGLSYQDGFSIQCQASLEAQRCMKQMENEFAFEFRIIRIALLTSEIFEMPTAHLKPMLVRHFVSKAEVKSFNSFLVPETMVVRALQLGGGGDGVHADHANLWDISYSLCTFNVCVAALSSCICNVECSSINQVDDVFKEVFKTETQTREAIARWDACACKSSVSLERVPWSFRTRELCILLAKRNSHPIHVPREHRVFEVYATPIINGAVKPEYYPSIPLDMWTAEVVEGAIRTYGLKALQSLPLELHTFDLCVLAAQHPDLNLRHELWDCQLSSDALCEAIFCANPAMLEFLPTTMWTRDRCLKAMYALASNKKLFIQAVNILFQFQENDENPWTLDLCADIVAFVPRAFYAIPLQMLTPELCARAVHNHAHNLVHLVSYIDASLVPSTFLTADMCADAVQQNGCLIEVVPFQFRSPELCARAVPVPVPVAQTLDPLERTPVDKHIPEDLAAFVCCNRTRLKAEELFNAMVTENGDWIRHVPRQFRTSALCAKAITNCPDAIQFLL
jgi:hypothetical protein